MCMRYFNACLIFTCAFGFALSASELEEDLKKERQAIPEFPAGLSWLNTVGGKPLTLADLKGKVVLLDFWTFGCINCMHIFPDLKRLEQKYEKELVVIGVHSAKFSNEKGLESIRNAARRHGLVHPILNDHEQAVWKAYGVRAWPTVMLVDPAGRVVGKVEGEGHYETLDAYIEATVKYFDARKLLDREKVVGRPEPQQQTPLRFPGKVLAQDKPERLIVSDTNHHRLVVCNLDGTVTAVIGSGTAGLKDGGFADARFHMPQGLAIAGDTLYVADTENHALRKVDLSKRIVETIAGTGELKFNSPPGPAMQTALNSPWDLALAPGGRLLYIAMAGNHAIWTMDLEKGTVGLLAGRAPGDKVLQDRKGIENIVDGAFRNEAAFAQPSGLWLDGDSLYVADAETSAIRLLDLKEKQVSSLVGIGLFDFGDKDGIGDEVEIQHCLALLLHEGKLFFADTYNNKIKTLDPRTRECRTFLGDGQPGKVDGGGPRFYEPGGLALLHGKLYVADTNNHALRVIDLKTKQTKTLELQFPKP